MRRINLLPVDLKASVLPKAETWVFQTVLACFFGYMGISSAYLGAVSWWHRHELGQVQARQFELNEKLGPLKLLAAEQAKTGERFASLQTILNRKNGWSEAFGEFSRRLPTGVWFTGLSSVRTEGSRQFVLRGQALSQAKMAEFLADLDHSRTFAGATVNYSELEPNIKPEVYRFELSIPIREPAAAGAP